MGDRYLIETRGTYESRICGPALELDWTPLPCALSASIDDAADELIHLAGDDDEFQCIRATRINTATGEAADATAELLAEIEASPADGLHLIHHADGYGLKRYRVHHALAAE